MFSLDRTLLSKRVMCVLLAFVALVAGACSAETAVSVVDDASSTVEDAARVDPTPTVAVAPTEVPAEPATAVAEPEPSPTPEPESEPESSEATESTEASSDPDDDGLTSDSLNSLLGTSPTTADLDPSEVACIVEALAGDDTLTELATNDTDFDALSVDQQADVMVAAFDCAPDAIAEEFSSFAGDDDAALPPEVAECFVEAMSSDNPERRDVIIGFTSLGAERPVPEDSRESVVDTLVDCIDGDAMSQLLTDELLSDPDLAPAVDVDCVGGNFGGETMRPMWEALVDNPGADFDQLDAEQMGPLLDAIFGCISFGRVIAAEAAADGVDLSEDTIACIDVAMADIDIAKLIETGEGAEQIGGAMLGCLSPEELQAIGG